MPEGLFDSLGKWAAHNLFTNNTIGPSETIEFAPAGDWTLAEPVQAVVIRDHYQGSNEVRGDGIALEKPSGRTVRDSIVIEFNECVEIQTVQNRSKPDQVKVDDLIWSAVRTLGDDSAMRAVLFVRTTDIHVRRETTTR